MADVKVELVNSELNANIISDDKSTTDEKYLFYLCLNGKVIFKSKNWSNNPRATFNLKQSGSYFIQGYIKKNGVNNICHSNTFTFLLEEDKKKITDFLRSPSEKISYPIKRIFRQKYPYSDFLACGWSDSTSPLDFSNFGEFLQLNELTLHHSTQHGLAVITDKNCDFNFSRAENRYIFSGHLFKDESLFFGSDDINSKTATNNHEGFYSHLIFNLEERSFSVENDYFGHSKLYYFQSASFSCVSNNYHLLLLFLKDSKTSLSINNEKIVASLTFVGLQLFSQNFHHMMDVSPIKFLRSNKKITIKNGSVVFFDKEISKFLSCENFDSDKYLSLLHKAKDSIVSHVKAIFAHPRFRNIIVDLSGGLDSRLVLAAITNLSKDAFGEKIKINSYEVSSQPDDIRIAWEIISLFPLDFDNAQRVSSCFGNDILPINYWSYTLGNYYSSAPLAVKSTIFESARITGAYGEICARPYYSASFFNTDLDINDIDTFCDLFIKKFKKDALNGTEINIDIVKKLMLDEFSEIPGNTALEKLENHYLFYRNALHLSDQFRVQCSCPEFGPIQSRYLHRAKMLSFKKFEDSRLQHQLMSLLNPILASVRYEKEGETQMFGKLNQNGDVFSPPWLESYNISKRDLESVEKEWRESNKFTTPNPIDETEKRKIININKKIKEESIRTSLLALKFLHEKKILPSGLIETIYYFLVLNEEISDYRKWVLINRVMSAYIQCAIVENENSKQKESINSLRVLIFGSCVSRDILNYQNGEIELVDYFARSSFASMFEFVPVKDIYTKNLKSNFQRRTVAADLGKNFSDHINGSSFDLLLLDFIDERFNLFVLENNTICTLSNELLSAGFDPKKESGRIVSSGTDEFFDLWETGWMQFLSIADALQCRQKIRINRVFWAKSTSTGGDFPTCSRHYILVANQFLQRLYARVEKDLQPWQFIEASPSHCIAAENHRWGLSPFHYVDAYYTEALRKIMISFDSR